MTFHSNNNCGHDHSHDPIGHAICTAQHNPELAKGFLLSILFFVPVLAYKVKDFTVAHPFASFTVMSTGAASLYYLYNIENSYDESEILDKTDHDSHDCSQHEEMNLNNKDIFPSSTDTSELTSHEEII